MRWVNSQLTPHGTGYGNFHIIAKGKVLDLNAPWGDQGFANHDVMQVLCSKFGGGYEDGDQNQFYTLLSENSEAFSDSYGLFKGSGYDGSEDDYKEHIGLQKKDVSVSQDLPFQKDTKDSASESQEQTSSLGQRIDDSLSKRLASI